MWHWPSLHAPLRGDELISVLNRRMKALENDIAALWDETNGYGTWADGDATPSVAGKLLWRTANTGATNVTALDDGRPGMCRLIMFKDADTTLVHGAALSLASGANFTGAVGNVKEFVTDDGTNWREVP